MIIADTSGLLAAVDPDEVHHEACRSIVAAADGPLVLSPFVLCEFDYLVARKLGTTAERALLGDVAAGAYQLALISAGDVAAGDAIIEQYRDLGVGLTDASLVVLASRHDTRDILTLDERHFRVMRTSGGEPFRLLPADA